MENTDVHTRNFDVNSDEFRHIKSLITNSGADTTKILCMYPHYSRKDILNIRRHIEAVRFLSDKATARIIGGQQYIIRPVFLGGQNVKSAIIKLAENKTLQDMGFDVPLLDFDK